ncbi:FAD-dependent oxidoreductase, partial [Bordetella bronchiseptica]
MPPPLPYDAMRSVWTDTAAPAMATAPLAGHADCDVAIVGAGITGLSAALHLAERGLRACVLEARDPGWGASGRNGGQVIPGIKHDPDEIGWRWHWDGSCRTARTPCGRRRPRWG